MNNQLREQPLPDEAEADDQTHQPGEWRQVYSHMPGFESREYTNENGDAVREFRSFDDTPAKNLEDESIAVVDSQTGQKTTDSKRYEGGVMKEYETSIYPSANSTYYDRCTTNFCITEGPEHIAKIDRVFATEAGRTPNWPQKLTYEYGAGRLDQKWREVKTYDLNHRPKALIEDFGLRKDRKFKSETHYSPLPGYNRPEFTIDHYWPGRPDGKIRETNRLDHNRQTLITNELFHLRRDGLVRKTTAHHKAPNGESYAIVDETYRDGWTGEETQNRYYLVDGGQAEALPDRLKSPVEPAEPETQTEVAESQETPAQDPNRSPILDPQDRSPLLPPLRRQTHQSDDS